VNVTNGARIDLFLNRPGSTVDFTDAFWSANRTWPAVIAGTVAGALQLGTISADTTGRSASGWGVFSLQNTTTAVNVVWTAASAWQQWQAMNFGANWNNATIAGPTADPDRDGVSNEKERILGTNPNHASPHPLTLTKTSATQVTLSFSALEASGAGFTGLTRRYTLESTTDLTQPASWQPVPGYQAIAGANQFVTTDQPIAPARRCYRLKVWLE
jgi:hypothetical protein